MHLSASKFDFDKDTKLWYTQTSKLKCAIPSWSIMYPGELGEIGIFFYIGLEADIHKYSLLYTIRNSKQEIDHWELFPIPSHTRDFKLKGYKMYIYNDQEIEYA